MPSEHESAYKGNVLPLCELSDVIYIGTQVCVNEEYLVERWIVDDVRVRNARFSTNCTQEANESILSDGWDLLSLHQGIKC